MKYYSYESFVQDVREISKQIKKSYEPDVILAIARGGLTLGHFIAQALETNQLYSLNSIHYEYTQKLDTIDVFNIPDLSNAKKVLIVDDIIDSGETMIEIKRILLEKYPHLQLQVATIFYKQKALLRPEFALHEADEYVDFFWEFKLED